MYHDACLLLHCSVLLSPSDMVTSAGDDDDKRKRLLELLQQAEELSSQCFGQDSAIHDGLASVRQQVGVPSAGRGTRRSVTFAPLPSEVPPHATETFSIAGPSDAKIDPEFQALQQAYYRMPVAKRKKFVSEVIDLAKDESDDEEDPIRDLRDMEVDNALSSAGDGGHSGGGHAGGGKSGSKGGSGRHAKGGSKTPAKAAFERSEEYVNEILRYPTGVKKDSTKYQGMRVGKALKASQVSKTPPTLHDLFMS